MEELEWKWKYALWGQAAYAAHMTVSLCKYARLPAILGKPNGAGFHITYVQPL